MSDQEKIDGPFSGQPELTDDDTVFQAWCEVEGKAVGPWTHSTTELNNSINNHAANTGHQTGYRTGSGTP